MADGLGDLSFELVDPLRQVADAIDKLGSDVGDQAVDSRQTLVDVVEDDPSVESLRSDHASTPSPTTTTNGDPTAHSAAGAVAYQLLPKATPAGSPTNTHYRIRRDRIDKTGAVSLRRAGRMHHISIGRAHAGTPIVLIIADLDIRVVATTIGELLRHLTFAPPAATNPAENDQGPNLIQVRPLPMSRDIAIVSEGGLEPVATS